MRLAPPEVAYIINDSKGESIDLNFPLIEEIKNDIPTVKKLTVGGSHEEWEDYLIGAIHMMLTLCLKAKAR